MTHQGDTSNPHRILVIANETVASERLHRALAALDPEEARILVVAPALNGRVRHWTSDLRAARRRASDRLLSCLRSLASLGLDANGHIGDSDPLVAIEDALVTFPADEILLVTHAPGSSNWLERDIVTRAIERFPLTISHLVAEDVPTGRARREGSLPVAA